MVKLSHSWITPYRHYFTTPIRVQMGTAIENAKIHYTLDGTQPCLTSPAYTVPLSLEETTTVKMAAFVGGETVGAVLKVPYVRVPSSPRR
jgi:hypothetical protein